MVGFLAVIGIVAGNGIMLISHCSTWSTRGRAVRPRSGAARCRERLVPITMTVVPRAWPWSR